MPVNPVLGAYTRALFLLLLMAALAASHYAVFQWGNARATHKTASACQQLQLDQLAASLTVLDVLAADADRASRALTTKIHQRALADAHLHQEISRALKTTAPLRVDCVLDDDVMHYLTAARDRANHAAASGLGDPVPATAAPER